MPSALAMTLKNALTNEPSRLRRRRNPSTSAAIIQPRPAFGFRAGVGGSGGKGGIAAGGIGGGGGGFASGGLEGGKSLSITWRHYCMELTAGKGLCGVAEKYARAGLAPLRTPQITRICYGLKAACSRLPPDS